MAGAAPRAGPPPGYVMRLRAQRSKSITTRRFACKGVSGGVCTARSVKPHASVVTIWDGMPAWIKRVRHGVGPLLRQLHVVVGRTGGVGVAVHHDPAEITVPDVEDDVVERRLRLGRQVVLVELEVDGAGFRQRRGRRGRLDRGDLLRAVEGLVLDDRTNALVLDDRIGRRCR